MNDKTNIRNMFRDKNRSMFGNFKVRYVLLRVLILWIVMFVMSIALIINKLDDKIYGQFIKDILMIKGVFNTNTFRKFFIPNYFYQISLVIF